MLTRPIHRENLDQLSEQTDLSAQALDEKLIDAKIVSKKEQDRQWICDFFGEDIAWYEATKRQVKAIRDALPRELDGREALIRQYGWIKHRGRQDLSLPLVADTPSGYAHALAVATIFESPDGYLRAMSWD